MLFAKHFATKTIGCRKVCLPEDAKESKVSGLYFVSGNYYPTKEGEIKCQDRGKDVSWSYWYEFNPGSYIIVSVSSRPFEDIYEYVSPSEEVLSRLSEIKKEIEDILEEGIDSYNRNVLQQYEERQKTLREEEKKRKEKKKKKPRKKKKKIFESITKILNKNFWMLFRGK